jgi:hypothetical protein
VGELVILDVVAFIFGERIEEDAAVAAAEGDKDAKAATAALAFAGDALLDEAGAEVRVDEATLGAVGRLAQLVVVDALSTCQARELPWLRRAAQASPSNNVSPLGA